MTEGVLIAIIGGVQAIMLGLLAKIGRDTRTVKGEVKNDHTTNMREEQDDRHNEQMAEMRGIRRDIGRLDTRDIQRGVEIRDLTRKVDRHLDWSAEWSDQREAAERRMEDQLEQTINPKKENPHAE